jgi:hypothetical protein
MLRRRALCRRAQKVVFFPLALSTCFDRNTRNNINYNMLFQFHMWMGGGWWCFFLFRKYSASKDEISPPRTAGGGTYGKRNRFNICVCISCVLFESCCGCALFGQGETPACAVPVLSVSVLCCGALCGLSAGQGGRRKEAELTPALCVD